VKAASASREQLHRRGRQRRRIALGFLDDAGPAQEIDDVDASLGAEPAPHGRRVLDQPVEEVLVQRELAACRRSRPDIKRCVDLAAARNGANGAAVVGFGRPQLFGQSQANLEIAVIDAADLPGEEPAAVVRSARAKPVMLLNIGLASPQY
jgi:hypothetical protein